MSGHVEWGSFIVPGLAPRLRPGQVGLRECCGPGGPCDARDGNRSLDTSRARYPDKFLPEDEVFAHIRRGDRIFLGTACGEPQHLVHALTDYVKAHPKAFFDAEILQVWTLGVAPYTDEQLKSNFRHNSFFIGNNTRRRSTRGWPTTRRSSCPQVPDLFHRRIISIDIALIQTSLPDRHGFLSLGVQRGHREGGGRKRPLVVAQVNPQMPRVHGDGFLHIDEVDYRRPVRRAAARIPPERARRHRHPHRPVRRPHRRGRRHDPGRLRQHAERHHGGARAQEAPRGAHRAAHRRHRRADARGRDRQLAQDDQPRQDASRPSAWAAAATYDFIDDNPTIEFRTIDYTNNPLVIAQHDEHDRDQQRAARST